MNIVGISDTHDSSCCLIQNGKLKFACAEERFQRIKNHHHILSLHLGNQFHNFGIESDEVDIS